MYYLETIAAICLKVGLGTPINELMKLSEYQRSRSLFDLGKRSLIFQKFFLDTVESFGTKFMGEWE